MILLTLCIIAALLLFGLQAVCAAPRGRSTAGRRALRKIAKWENRQRDVWEAPPLNQLSALAARAVPMNESTAANLKRNLERANLSLTPQEYTARKYLIVSGGILLAGLCAVSHFYLGILVAALGTVFALMRQRDTLHTKIRQRERAVSAEMPRFVRSLCRSLQSDRDLESVVGSYRKVAGPELGEELDILLAEMRSGNVQTALLHFETRIGTPEVSRLCAALRGMSLGIDQTATLEYLADDMSRQAKENVRKELSLRPGKMRATYYPAIGVCIAMILYVLVVYVIHNLNSIV